MHVGELLPVAHEIFTSRPAKARLEDKAARRTQTRTIPQEQAYLPMISTDVRNRRERIIFLVLFVEFWVGSRVEIGLSFVAGCGL